MKQQKEKLSSGFERLRLCRPAVAAVGAAGLGIVDAANATIITAGGFDLTIGGVSYSNVGRNNTVDSPLTGLPGATGGSAYGLATDATFVVSGRGDAFDDFGGITVNGMAFNQPNNMIDFSSTVNGVFLNTLAPANLGGINTSLDFFYDASSPTARVFGTFSNTTGTAQSIDVAYGGDLGSDSGTIFQDSSNGDNVFDQAADRWIISSDGFPDSGDPVLTFVRFGPGGLAPSSTPSVPGLLDSNGDFDNYADIWTLTLQPGETQSLMMFVQFNDSLLNASTGALDFDSLASLQAAGYTVGLTNSQLNQTVNWAAIPEPGFSLGFCILFAGFIAWWRR